MSYTDLRDFVPETTHLFENSNIVLIEKSGGGSIGKMYFGEDWRYVVLLSEGPRVYVCAKGTITLNGWQSHESAAKSVYEYYNEGDI